MELEGEKYYLEQAEKNKGNSLYTIFHLLAKDEKLHAKLLQNMENKLISEQDNKNTVLESNTVFTELRDFSSEIKEIPDQLDLYRMALSMEQKSIDLYKKFLSEATDTEEQELFRYLIKQEENHFTIIEEFILHLNRTNDWVESAEFGNRDDY